MQKLMSKLAGLYLPRGTVLPDALRLQMLGHAVHPVSAVSDEGRTRAIVIEFRRMPESGEGQQWTLLCEVANALQTELGLPAPVVSISGADGFCLWLSLEEPTPTTQVQAFLESLRDAYFPGMALRPDAAGAQLKLPPYLHPGTGLWAAFINPGLGASFTDTSGLEMAPPFAGQSALLEQAQSISDAQFQHALEVLRPPPAAAPAAVAPEGLLLKDATLEDIVRHLHAMHIEPTFRHLLRG